MHIKGIKKLMNKKTNKLLAFLAGGFTYRIRQLGDKNAKENIFNRRRI